MNYEVRLAHKNELQEIYLMGYDVWTGENTKDEYLVSCSESKKYQSGVWYVLLDNNNLISSLIVYSSGFSLPLDSYGIGSISTKVSFRKKGYVNLLVSEVVNKLLLTRNSIYLHSDIDCSFYEKLGFSRINESHCMIKANDNLKPKVIPNYF